MLDTVTRCQGKVLLSGYSSDLYATRLASWNCHRVELANHAAGGKTKRRMVECLWHNY